MPQFGFGSGLLVGMTTDTPPQAAIFGALQECSLDFSFTNKELYGGYQFPIDVGRGKSKIDCKAKAGQIRSDIYASLFFGQAKVAGQTKVAFGEAGTIPTTPFAITVANSATWVLDLGVMDASAKPMIRIDAGGTPTTGQYKVTAGVYTFAAADTGLAVTISYTYTAAGGFTTTINNQLLGASPNFSVVINQLFETKHLTIILNKCISSKLTIPTKLDDYVITGFDFSAMADANGVVGKISLSE